MLKFLSAVLIIFIFSGFVYTTKEGDEQLIREAREASNKALQNFDDEAYYQFLTDDVLLTSGSGNLIVGKKAVMEYSRNDEGLRRYYIRTPEEIEVNTGRGLAWEKGTWQGFEEGRDQPVFEGRYAAQWTKESGKWLIRSQLFVTLSER